jgi:NADH dehydrogenase FAD-containing subunit
MERKPIRVVIVGGGFAAVQFAKNATLETVRFGRLYLPSTKSFLLFITFL